MARQGRAPPAFLELRPGLVIDNGRYALWPASKTLAIADLHLGFEGAAAQDGAYFPRVQKKAVMERLVKVLSDRRPARILVCGDLKHTFDRNLDTEWEEIKEVVALLKADGRQLDLIKGNHDNFLKNALPKDVTLETTMETEDAIFVHGHKMPENGRALLERTGRDGRTLVLGHEHPGIRLKDGIGAVLRLPCFLYHRKADLLILPAFSFLTEGTDVLTNGFMSPLLKDMAPAEFEAIAVSEIGLLAMGRLGEI